MLQWLSTALHLHLKTTTTTTTVSGINRLAVFPHKASCAASLHKATRLMKKTRAVTEVSYRTHNALSALQR